MYPPFNTLNADNVKLTITGLNEERKIKTGSATEANSTSLFTVGAAGKTGIELTLGNNITLVGRSGAGAAVVKVLPAAEFTMLAGSKITGNNHTTVYTALSVTNTGGGLWVNGGTFTMKGGEISGNTLSATGTDARTGGGVVVDIRGEFTMNGGTICDNTVQTASSSARGGGVYVAANCEFTMNGGTISKNKAAATGSGSGGGVCTLGKFTMLGGIIGENEASSAGGGVFIVTNGSFVMTNGTISGNTAGTDGGGVNINTASTSSFSMFGGTISGNTANRPSTGTNGGGGGVYALGVFHMAEGTISGNEAKASGGGVYIGGNGNLRMISGTIYGSDAAESLKNTAVTNNSSALFKNALGTAAYGINADDTFEAKGNLTTSDDTIRVVNGVVQ